MSIDAISAIVDLSTGDVEEKPESVKARSGRLGGLKGGKVRADKITSEERSKIAKKGAEAKWTKYYNSTGDASS